VDTGIRSDERPAGLGAAELAGMLHDEVLQCVIAARWALDDVEPDVPEKSARAVAQAVECLDRSMDVLQTCIVALRSGAGAASAATELVPAPGHPAGGGRANRRDR
jgi:hypothetical protein